MSACRDFARWVIRESCFDGCYLEGEEIQEKAAELGLITEMKYDPSIHGEHDYCEPGDTFFVFSGELAEPTTEPRPPIFPSEWVEDEKEHPL